MSNAILWGLWYGILVTLPPVVTRMLIKHAMARAVARHCVPPSMKRSEEVRYGILQDR